MRDVSATTAFRQRGTNPAPNRACLEGLLWLLQSRARYKDIPKHFPSQSTCWRRLHWWHEQCALLAHIIAHLNIDLYLACGNALTGATVRFERNVDGAERTGNRHSVEVRFKFALRCQL